MTTVSRAEFARLMGVNKSTVTRWAEKGQIVVESGQVNVEASRERLRETGGARPDVADRHASERGTKVGAGETATVKESLPVQQQDDRVGNSYQAARAVKEKYAALGAKLDYERAVGNLIPKEDVDLALRSFGASVRAKLDVVADQIAPLVAPVSDLDEVHALVSEHMRGILTAVADDMGRAAVAAGKSGA